MKENNLTKLHVEDKTIILIGTAHVSRESVEEVKRVIEEECPDTVCVELDQQRYNTIFHKNQWQQMNLSQVIKEKKSTFLLVNFIISSFQRRIAKQFDINPGQEMIQAIESAKKINANIVLADRNIQTTFLRIWRGIGLKGKAQLLSNILLSLFDDAEISEEELENLKSKDTLTSLLEELTISFPKLKHYLLDERDQYLAQKIKTAPGKNIIAILGAAHVPGVIYAINHNHNLESLESIPSTSNKRRFISWILPLLIISMLIATYYYSHSAAVDITFSWIFWNGILSAIGTLIALGHPISIITSLLVSPIASLTPILGAGWITGLVEAYVRKPNVQDFENIPKDITTLKGFWQNKITRVLLVAFLTSMGSALGNIIGGADAIRIFLKTIKGS